MSVCVCVCVCVFVFKCVRCTERAPCLPDGGARLVSPPGLLLPRLVEHSGLYSG